MVETQKSKTTHPNLFHKIHKINLTQKIGKSLEKQVEENSDPSPDINWKDKKWTTELREVECFASISKDVKDCFTCPQRISQNKAQFLANSSDS